MICDIIDFHTHPLYDFHLATHGVAIDLQKFRNDLLANGINHACGSVLYRAVNNQAISEYEKLIPQLNDQAIAVHDLLGDFYIPGIHVHPAFVDLSCREIERCHAKGIRLIGELVPYMMGWQACASPGFLEIMTYAQELDMTVNIHPTAIPDMYALSAALPKLKLVWAHLSGYGGFADHLKILKKYDHVCFDISAYGTVHDGTLRHTIDQVGYERILFGSDYPGIGPAADLAAVYHEKLSSAELEAILSTNARRLLMT